MTYSPDFTQSCHVCGARPTVVVADHEVPDTELCGKCFFNDRLMTDWTLWNDSQEETE